ncbi:MAG: glycosyl transferase [Rhizobacter sp.]|nr:glycosyl transferase [Rhizobacter sp.]
MKFVSAAMPVAAASSLPRPDERWSGVRRVLTVRLDNLGDVLMTTPALAALKSASADACVTLLASTSGAAVARLTGVVDDVIVYDAPWSKGGAQPRSVDADFALVERLKQGRFDAAVIFTVCTQSALPAAMICRMAGIPLRLAHCRENPYDLLTDWVPDREVVENGMRHEVTRQLDLVRSVGFTVADDSLRLVVQPGDAAGARRHLEAAGVAIEQPYFVVHTGATAASRRYPARWFGSAADRIAAATGCRAVFTGSADEAPLVQAAAGAMSLEQPVNMAGRLSLGELAGLLAGARLLLSNNSGPVHLAAALGTPVVDVYALTNPQHTPWRVPSRVLSHDVPCRNCLKSVCPLVHNDCIRGVAPGQLVDASLDLMQASPILDGERSFDLASAAGASSASARHSSISLSFSLLGAHK